jgi:hypothetical protein
MNNQDELRHRYPMNRRAFGSSRMSALPLADIDPADTTHRA